MQSPELLELMRLMGRMPGLGPRSGRRLALHLIKERDRILEPFIESLKTVFNTIKTCGQCGNLDTRNPCSLCTDPKRDCAVLCIIEDVADLWAIERTSSFHGHYHVLGGTLSAMNGIGPEALGIPRLSRKIKENGVSEVILALNATLDGQTTAHYIQEVLQESGVTVTALSYGVPVGGELDYLDDGTLSMALKGRRSLVV